MAEPLRPLVPFPEDAPSRSPTARTPTPSPRLTLAPLVPFPDELEDDETRFQQWYADHAKRLGLDPNPDDPRHRYDYRAAFKAGATPDVSGHWPSQFKTPDHPNRYVDGIDTITGGPVTPIPSSMLELSADDTFALTGNPVGPVAGKRAQMAEAAAFAERQNAAMAPKPHEPYGRAVLGEALARGAAGVVGAAGGLLEREASAVPRRAVKLMAATGLLPTPLAISALRDAPTIEPLAEAGRALQKVPAAVRGAAPPPTYAQDFWKGMKTDPAKTMAISLAENLPNMVAVIAASAVNPALGMGTAYALEAGNSYQQVKDSGGSEEEARAVSGWVGLGNMALDWLPAGRLLKQLPGGTIAAKRSLMTEMLKQGAAEGVTESLQEANQVISQALTTEKWPSFWDFAKRIGESLVTGTLLGIFGGGAGAAVRPQVEEVVQPNNLTTDLAADGTSVSAIVPPPVAPEPQAAGSEVLPPSLPPVGELQKYARLAVANPKIEAVGLVGSRAVGKADPSDTDLLYRLRPRKLSDNSADASAEVERLLESMPEINLDLADTHIQVGNRFFHLQEGAGRAIVENTDYAREQKGKPRVWLAQAPPAAPEKRRIDAGLRREVQDAMERLRGASDAELANLQARAEQAGDRATEIAIERLAFERRAGTHSGPPEQAPGAPPLTPIIPFPEEVPSEKAQKAEAPEAAPVLKPPPPPRAPIVTGAQDVAVTERGDRIEFDYAVMDARDLIASNDDTLRPNPSYPQELQPRDRTRATSETQVSRIQKTLNPELLAASPRVSDGAPIVGEDRVVESGNARTIGIRRAYKDAGEPAERYSGWISDHAQEFGIPAEALAGIEQPVLVRVRRTPVDRAEFARRANEGTLAALSVTERAMADAGRLTPEMLEGLRFPDIGDINWTQNRDFVQAFGQRVVSPNEQGMMYDERGQLSLEGQGRLRNAVLAKAYGDPDAVGRLIESADSNVKNVGTGMLRAAPRLVRLQADIGRGALYPLDIADDVTAAVRKLSTLREEGTKVETYLAQQAMFGSDLSAEARELLAAFDAHGRSSQRVADILRRYAELAEGTGDPRQTSLMGRAEIPSKLSLIQEAVRTREQAGQGDLFTPAVQGGQTEAGFVQMGGQAPPQPGPQFSRPEAEAEFQAARKGVTPKGALQRAREGVRDLYHRWTRVHYRIPHGRKFARFQESLRLLEHQPDVAADWVEERIGPALRSLNDQQRDLFDRKLLVDNLEGILSTYDPGTEIPFLEPGEVPTEKGKVNAAVGTDPAVQKALARHRETFAKARTELADAYKAVGMDPEPLFKQGETYLHHQVLEYADPSRGIGSRLKKPVGRSWQRSLKGSKLPFNLHYLQAQGKVLAEMRVATVMAHELAKLEKNYDIAPEVRKQAREAGEKNWQKLIPEGYDIWQPQKGSALFPAQRIAEEVAEKILLDGVAEVTSDDLAKGLMLGGPRKQLVLPVEIVDTLNELNNPIPPSKVSHLSRVAMRGFKKVSLFFPRRVVKYLFRNYVGDTQALTRSNPRALRRLGQAASELRTFLGDGVTPSPEFEAWHFRGGLTANLRAQELESSERARLVRVARAGERLDWKSIGRTLAKEPVRGARQVWRRVIAGGNVARVYLESLNRYASFLEYLDQIRSSPDGRPKNYGASIPEEIMALEDFEDRAYWLSNQSLGAYDQVTEMGRTLRSHLVPFYSFQELAVRSNYRLLRNELAASPEAHAGYALKVFGRQALKRSPFLVLGAGKFLALAYAFEAMMATWNRLLFDEEDDDLPDEVRKQAHIVFGRDDNGNVIYFNRLSVFEEVRDWFGMDEFGAAAMDYLDGRATAAEVAQRMLLQPIDKAVSALTPIGAKGAGELVTGKTTFPHATRPRDIEDRGEYLARLAGGEKEYRYLFGKPDPSRSYLRSWLDAVVYTAEPGAAAYFDTLTYRRLYLKSIGKEDEGYGAGAKTVALRNYKRAIRYKQPDVALKYLQEYVALKGTERGMAQSLDRMDPLFGVKDEEAFRKWLRADEAKKLDKAIKYYNEVIRSSDDLMKTEAAKEILRKAA